MRHLWLLRHAKSSWGDPQLDDHERPLAPRGIEAAARMAAYLDTAEVRPGLVLCSSALRTRQTLSIVLPALGPELIVSLERGLYTFSSRPVLERLTRVPTDMAGVLVVGHNPATEELARDLARPSEALDALRIKYPTGALAAFDLDIDLWSALTPGCGDLTAFVTPASLG